MGVFVCLFLYCLDGSIKGRGGLVQHYLVHIHWLIDWWQLLPLIAITYLHRSRLSTYPHSDVMWRCPMLPAGGAPLLCKPSAAVCVAVLPAAMCGQLCWATGYCWGRQGLQWAAGCWFWQAVEHGWSLVCFGSLRGTGWCTVFSLIFGSLFGCGTMPLHCKRRVGLCCLSSTLIVTLCRRRWSGQCVLVDFWDTVFGCRAMSLHC